ncbi:hypothetical protein LCGC14_1601190, partial [marine sediment metagenome]
SRKECDLEKDPIPFPDNTFDVVFCKSVLEHLRYTYIANYEMRRVLKKNGLLIIMTPVVNKYFFSYSEHINPQYFANAELFYQFPWVWKHPWLKIIPKLIAWLIPDKYRFRKDGTQRVLIRHSKEPVWLLCGRK